MAEFEAWPKIPRWNREIVITEKIDGTNAAIIIEAHPFGAAMDPAFANTSCLALVLDYATTGEDGLPEVEHHVYAQSRTRLITPEQDNFGFATHVKENAEGLVKLLGPGRHFGEWYGKGIQRNYGLDERRFALFNVGRWGIHTFPLSDELRVDVVPVLIRDSAPGRGAVEEALEWLNDEGSALVPGFMKPEGVVIYHTAGRQTYKVLLEGDDTPKGVAA